MNPRLSTLFFIAVLIAGGVVFYKTLSRPQVPPMQSIVTPAGCPATQVQLSPEVKAYIDAKIAAMPKGDQNLASVISQISRYEYQLREMNGKLDMTGLKEQMNRVLKLAETKPEEERQRLYAARQSELRIISEEIQNTCRAPEPQGEKPAEGEGEAQ